MEIKLLKCFVTVADELHFGRAAHQLDILPSALGRNIRLLEEALGCRLFARTTRNVILTRSGIKLLNEIRPVIEQFDDALNEVRKTAEIEDKVFRVGAIDSAATGLLPQLVHDFHEQVTDIELILEEDKTAKLLPKLLSGALDIAFVRPPMQAKEGIHFEFLMKEPTVVAVHADSELAKKSQLTVYDLADVPLIVPSPRNRPHSYNLTNNLFLQAGLVPNYAQQAEQKHTIVNLVGAKVGVAIIPYWTSRLNVKNVVFRPLVDHDKQQVTELPLAAAWLNGTVDKYRDELVHLVRTNLTTYAQ